MRTTLLLTLALPALVGCKAAVVPPRASSSSLVIPPMGSADATKTNGGESFLQENASVPVGCFAISKRTGKIACVVGEYTPTGLPSVRSLTFLTPPGQDVLPDVELHVAPASTTIENDSRETLNAIMREGDFVRINLLPEMIVLHAPGRAFGKLSIELQRTRASHPTGVMATAWDVHVIVHAVGKRIFKNTLSDVECEAPTLSVRVAGGNYILERVCRQGDSEDGPSVVGAWLCSEETLSCD